MSQHEISKGSDSAQVGVRLPLLDFANWDFQWTCEKWSEDACKFVRKQLGLVADAEVRSAALRSLIPFNSPDFELVEVHGNSLTNVGIARLESLLIGAGGQAYDATHARMGVGDDATAFSASQTDLVAAAGSSHRQFVTMNATYPLGPTAQVLTWQSDFTSGLANFAWAEWCIDAGTANGVTITTPMLNRKVESLGTKVTGTWTLSGAVTIS